MDNPFISVIIPTYNGALYLREAVASIRAQHYSPLEIIIVDDGSQDNTPGIAKSFGQGVRFVSQPHSGGPATGRNRGIRMAEGALIAFLDQDDLWPSMKLKRQTTKLSQKPSLDFVLGQVQPLRLVKTEHGKHTFEEDTDPCFPLFPSSGLFRLSVFDKVGLFDSTIPFGNDDLDWFLRARENGASMLIMNEITLFWRQHENNTSKDKAGRDYDKGYDHGLMHVLKKSFIRRKRNSLNSTATLPLFSQFREKPIESQEKKPTNEHLTHIIT